MTNRRDIIGSVPLYLLAVAAPLSISLGTMATGVALLAALAILITSRGAWGRVQTPVLQALGALLGFYFLATWLSQPFPHHWHKCVEEMWIKLLIVAIPVLGHGRRSTLEKAVKLAILVGAVGAVFAIIQHFLGMDPLRGRSIYRPQFGHHAVSGFFSHHLSYAGQVLIFLVMTASWYLERPTARRSFWLLPVLGVFSLALMWSFGRSAQIGTAAGLLVLGLVQPGRYRWRRMGAVALSLCGFLIIPAVRHHLLLLLQMDRHLTRLNLWQSSVDGILANPLLGLGPGNFEALVAQYQVPGHYETFGHAHNDLLMHGVNAGLPGIAAALILLVVVCRVLWRALPRSGSSGGILRGALAVQAAITVAGFFQVFQTDDEVEMLLYFVLGCALALARDVPDESRLDDSTI